MLNRQSVQTFRHIIGAVGNGRTDRIGMGPLHFTTPDPTFAHALKRTCAAGSMYSENDFATEIAMIRVGVHFTVLVGQILWEMTAWSPRNH